jgi:hypothetical protein
MPLQRKSRLVKPPESEKDSVDHHLVADAIEEDQHMTV